MSNKTNSSAPTTSQIVGGVASASAPAPAEGQGTALSFDLSGNLRVTSSGGGGSSDVNIADVSGNPPALSNPLPVELSDGTNALGTNTNPIRISPSSTAATQPISAAALPLPSNAAQETGGNLATLAGTVSAAKVAVSVASLPLPSNAAQETGGNLAILAGAVSGSKFQDNIAQIAGSTVATATTGVQLVGIEGRAGTSLETTAGVLDQNIKNIGNSAVSTAASGVQKVGVVGNAGAIFDGATAATVPANALQTGLRAATAYPTAVTDGQMVGAMADKAGRQVGVLNAPRDLVGTAVLNSSSGSLVSLIGAGAAGVFNDIVTFIATNESSTATIVSLSDGTTTYKYALAANGGIVINFPTPKPATSTATAWQVSNSAAVAVDYEALYVKNK